MEVRNLELDVLLGGWKGSSWLPVLGTSAPLLVTWEGTSRSHLSRLHLTVYLSEYTFPFQSYLGLLITHSENVAFVHSIFGSSAFAHIFRDCFTQTQIETHITHPHPKQSKIISFLEKFAQWDCLIFELKWYCPS